MDQVADLAGTSVRTLQRRLAADGLSFSEIADNARAELAAEMLCHTDASLSEIAREVGYSAVSNFSRAFRHWTGKTPAESRRE